MDTKLILNILTAIATIGTLKLIDSIVELKLGKKASIILNAVLLVLFLIGIYHYG